MPFSLFLLRQSLLEHGSPLPQKPCTRRFAKEMLWNRAVEGAVFKGDGRLSLGDCWLSQRCFQIEFEGGNDRRACEGFDEL